MKHQNEGNTIPGTKQAVLVILETRRVNDVNASGSCERGMRLALCELASALLPPA